MKSEKIPQSRKQRTRNQKQKNQISVTQDKKCKPGRSRVCSTLGKVRNKIKGTNKKEIWENLGDDQQLDFFQMFKMQRLQHIKDVSWENIDCLELSGSFVVSVYPIP